MSSIEKLSELRRKEVEIDKIFEELKAERKKEAIQQVQELLQKNDTERARFIIERLENLEDIRWERNEHVMERLAQLFEMPTQDSEVDYEQLKMDLERKENKKEIHSLFMNSLKNRGFNLEEKKADVYRLSKDGEPMFFFEQIEGKEMGEQIEAKLKYTTLLLGVETIEKEKEAEQQIKQWLAQTEQEKRESIKKYLKLKVTSKERLQSDMESFQQIKIA